MSRVEITSLIESGAHFGHLTRRWNPKMKPFIFMEKNGIHIIDLKKTQTAIEEAYQAMYDVASKGHSVLFVGTKKQARGVISEQAKRSNSNWVSERWLGGMLTNFQTIRKSVKRLQTIDKMESDGTFEKITKKERLMVSRERDKLRKILDGVETMQKMPGAVFIIDIKKESIAVQEAIRLNIPIFAIVDTNCDPDVVDYIIPSNDDAVSAIGLITTQIADAILEGQVKSKELRANEFAEKERNKKEKEESDDRNKDKKSRVRRVRLDGGKPSDRRSNEVKNEQKTSDSVNEVKTVEPKVEPKKDNSSEAVSDKE